MTFPMTGFEKQLSKEAIADRIDEVRRRLSIAENCLRVSAPMDFSSDYVVFAKNIILELAEVFEQIEHMLHDLIDAPVLEDGN